MALSKNGVFKNGKNFSIVAKNKKIKVFWTFILSTTLTGYVLVLCCYFCKILEMGWLEKGLGYIRYVIFPSYSFIDFPQV